jgi:hypothetical protein
VKYLQRKKFVANGFYRYSERLLAKKFDGVALMTGSINALESLKQQTHAIIYTTHASWWDVIADAYVAKLTGLEIHAPMDLDQLDKYWVLKYVGLFGVSSNKPLPFLRALSEIFTHTKRGALLITPQAELLSNSIPSPEFKRGLMLAIEKYCDIPVYAISLEYAFWNESRPLVLLAVMRVDRPIAGELEPHLRQTLDRQTSALLLSSSRRNSAEWSWLLRPKAKTLMTQDIAGGIRRVAGGKKYSAGHLR